MTSTDQQIRAWAPHRNIPLPANGTIPEAIRERYMQTRAYMIRHSYAQRHNRNRTVTR